ncbi:hypothetical protein QAD02_011161 [Eretmocerus hayati]|uniref:Uncharacterized protein n=1 Tax=Eretmocerus hayati TaxID=131215 RepID=A0ACC2P0Q6_9HYME|nr:hypothetical protein QAD02_011161 [Eretmocerus hayati]
MLKALKENAQKKLSCKTISAVITVAAYFGTLERSGTSAAGCKAGFKSVRIVDEPTAAAMSFGLDKPGTQTILVFDLGGGTSDVSVIQVSDGMYTAVTKEGDEHLGGEDFTQLLFEHVSSRYLTDHKIDFTTNDVTKARLRVLC